MDLSFTLDGARQTLSKKLKSYSGREVHIDGEIQLVLSYSPELLVKSIHIKNPADFDDEDFVTINEVHIEVLLLPLLRGQVHINDVSADQAIINLHQKADDTDNWTFTSSKEKETNVEKQTTGGETGTKGIDRISLDTINLTNVTINYRDDTRQQVINTHLDMLSIDATDTDNPVAEISGDVQGHPYAISFKSNSPKDLVTGQPLTIHGNGHIANRQTSLESSISFNENTFTINTDVDIKNVNLGQLLEELEIISGRDAATESLSIKAKLNGTDLAELYEHAEINLQLGKGYWNLQSKTSTQKKQLLFTRAASFTSWNKPVELHIDGSIEDQPMKIKFKTNRLQEFFDETQKIDLDLVASLADTDIILNGTLDLPVATNKFQLDIAIKGKDLEKLNPIFNTEFPPFNDFDMSGNLIANNKGYVLKSVKTSIGETQLQASIVIDTSKAKPLWNISLRSQQLQLKDFAFDDWSTKQTEDTAEKPSNQKNNERRINKPLRHIEDMVRTPEMHLDLNLKVEKLLSGKDSLGKARFQLHMHDNAFSVTNADIEIPGGRIKASLSLEIEDNEASGIAILNIDKLDYGITTRLFEPDSQVNGIMSIRADLQLEGADFTRLLDNASGEFDFVIWPRNTKPAKALNLWTTNLYLILLPELKKKESLVNCLVGLMDLEEGNMKEQLFAIDTTKLWIYGNIDIDFKQEKVKLSLFPQSKTARLFSLQTPIRTQGSFSDINLLINPVDIAGSYVSFITSPLHVPMRWVFADKVSEDGSAVCEQLFDREYVTKINAELKSREKEEVDELLEPY